MGPLEGILSSIGEELAELAGVRMTRLSALTAAGVTVLPVESTLGWATEGTLYLAGRPYTYTGITAASFTGLSPGLVEDQRHLAIIADGNRDYSGINSARRMLFVDTAEEIYLDVLGRDLGVPRGGLADADYREMIKVLAYGPRGTLQLLDAVLEVLVGAGNYTLFEDLVNYPNRVFISFPGLALGTSAAGRGFLPVREQLTVADLTSLTVSNPVAFTSSGRAHSVLGIFPASTEHLVSGDALPSSEPETPWAYIGAETEGSAVTVNGDGTITMKGLVPASTGPQYERELYAEMESGVVAAWRSKLNSTTGTSLDELNVRLSNGDREIAVAWSSAGLVGFYHTGTKSFIGSGTVVAGTALVRDYQIVMAEGERPDLDRVVELWMDGDLVATAIYTAFSVASSYLASFGSYAATDADWDVHWLKVETHDRSHNYCNLLRKNVTIAAGSSSRLSDAGNPFLAVDVGKLVRVSRSKTAHGRANGVYRVDSHTSGYLDVVGVAYNEGGQLLDAEQFRLPHGHLDPFTAEDAGVQAILTTGSGNASILWASRVGGAIGNSTTVQITDPSESSPLIVQVVGVAVTVISAHNGTSMTSTALDVVAAIAASPEALAVLTAEIPEGTTGASVVSFGGPASLAGGENGKTLTITQSTTGNNGDYNIATLIDGRTVILEASLTAEADLGFLKNPVFPTDTGVEIEVISATLVSGAGFTVIDFRRAPPSIGFAVEAVYQSVLSAHLLRDIFSRNDPVDTHYPLYLADPFILARTIAEAVTAAGVIPIFQ